MSNMSFMTSRDLADALGVSARQIARRVERGELEPVAKLPGLRGAYLFAPIAAEDPQA